MPKLSWYYYRLRSMEPAEVLHRVGELTRKRLSARRQFSWNAFRKPDIPLPRLAVELAPKGPERDVMAAQWQMITNDTEAGRYQALNCIWPVHKTADKWALDPVSGKLWPTDRFCFDIAFRHLEGLGDIKYVCEFNRLQHLQAVAALAHVEQRSDLADLCLGEIESWIDTNPPFNGVGWSSMIEVALRTISILVVISLLPKSALSDEQREKIKACLAAHAYWLQRFPSRFSSANNHLIAEAAGQFILGLVWPEFEDADRMEAYGRKTLVDEVVRQFHADGVGAEQSPTYACFTIEFYLLSLMVAEQVGRPLPESAYERLELAGEHLAWMLDANGNHPRIGDDDEGRVLFGQPGHEAHYVRSVLTALADRIGRCDLRPGITEPDLRGALIGRAERQRPSGAPVSGLRTFEVGGYSVVREKQRGRDVLFCFDHGPLGHLSIAAHGHADALAIWLHVDDRPVLVDAGTYLYHSGGKTRDQFRGTPVHNTLTINDKNSSQISGPFNWLTHAQAKLLDSTSSARSHRMIGEHDGYVRGSGVRHRREITIENGDIVIDDQLIGGSQDRSLDINIGFLLAPGITIENETNGLIFALDGERVLSMRNEDGLEPVIINGDDNLSRGWYSPRFGAKSPTNMIVYRAKSDTRRTFSTRLTTCAR